MTNRTPSTPTAAAAKKDGTALLQRDHREVQRLFKEFRKLSDNGSSGDERRALAERICAMLTVHTEIEEELFYPAAREAGVPDSLLHEAEVEHASAKELIAQIKSMQPDAALYDAKEAGRNAWVGLLDARAASEEELRQDIRRPLDSWAASGRLTLLRSGRG
jgi:hypothetical protein